MPMTSSVSNITSGTGGTPMPAASFNGPVLGSARGCQHESCWAKDAACRKEPAGPPMQETRPRLLVKGYADTPYNITGFDGRFYATHQEDGAFDLEKFRAGATKFPAYAGNTIDEVAQNIDAGFDNRMLRDIITGFGWRGRHGLVAEFGTDPNDFLLDAFFGSIDDVATALRVALRNQNGPFTLIGARDKTALLAEALSKDGHGPKIIEWSYGQPLPPLSESGRAILCEVPRTPDDYPALFGFKERYPGCETIWELTLPIAAVREMIAVFDYNVGEADRFARKPETLADHQRYFAQMASIYCARARRARSEGSDRRASMARGLDMLDLRGRTVIEFGPADGVNTGRLIATGARQITAVEGRPENVIKLLAAKYAMGWDNLEIFADNFQVPGRWASRRYDAVFAHGVLYHCVDPFYFCDQLTRISDKIFIGSWVATDKVPLSEWRELRYGGHSYRVQVYDEDAHFWAGLTTRSFFPDAQGVDDFFARAGYKAVLREEIQESRSFSGGLMEWIFVRA
jgi:hypothetical protein